MKLPYGFRASGVRAGIKPSGKPDLALLVGDEPLAWALASTENLVKAPCVVRNRARAASEGSRCGRWW
jgi:glutamate N-acetyltransferase / amino-acid N-acetyltransferase